MSEASHTTGSIAKIKWIALGTGGVDANREVTEPSPKKTGLNNEVLRREYTSATQKSDTCYEYELKLGELEFVGTYFSEIALVDEDGDAVALLHFLEKGKDETEVSFYIEDNY
jgi:hypothetical protein